MQRLKTREAEQICINCEKRFLDENPKTISCAIRMDDSYCDRIEDIDTLIDKLKNEE
jgi:hypothetical protein